MKQTWEAVSWAGPPGKSVPSQDKERQSLEHEEERKRLEQEDRGYEFGRTLGFSQVELVVHCTREAQKNIERLNEERKRRLRLLEEKAAASGQKKARCSLVVLAQALNIQTESLERMAAT